MHSLNFFNANKPQNQVLGFKVLLVTESFLVLKFFLLQYKINETIKTYLLQEEELLEEEL